ncbi:MAG: translocase FtsK protein [Parcubacteria group bacterium GW2011_GWA2_47_21]|nr:MAG: translocase FtsK protein [Parcubacteria group bacterium GW2011_GWA2_47_21]
MGKNLTNSKNKSKIKGETLKAVLGIGFFVLAIFFIIAAFGSAGIAGAKIYEFLTYLLGIGYFTLPALFTMLGIASFKDLDKKISFIRWLSSAVFVAAGLGIIYLVSAESGGLLGKWITYPLVKFFEKPATAVFLGGLLIISILMVLDAPLAIAKLFGKLFAWRKSLKKEQVKITTGENMNAAAAQLEDDDDEMPVPANQTATEKFSKEEEDADFVRAEPNFRHTPFIPIPINLLENDKGKPGVGDIKANVNIIKRTLQNFGIEVEMDEVSIGPSITRYALKPAEGVKLSRIVALQNDLALALAAHPIRIEAPIPGKSLVGIEIPNNVKTTVGLGTLIGSEEFQSSEKPLLMSLGKGISGKCYFGNLGKMPHLLIAGATGSGKSVCIHALITSLLYRNSPEDLRFIMIDPKRVELTLYNKIPHLLTPVITDAKKAIMALKWAAKEMEKRYNILESESVRDVESYHKNIFIPAVKRLESYKGKEIPADKIPSAMPYIIIIIDELADIMSTYPRELEAAIVRLAQMSRAVGIHLILSTQRPSVNVITGLIKANIPARVALQVASQIDSRTILDMGGAEKLLGAGDMLYLGSEMSQPHRIQSAFISETEVKRVVKFLHEKYKDMIPDEILIAEKESGATTTFSDMSFSDEENGDSDDDLYEEAKAEVLKAGKASTSYLQRRLRIGYARAARLIDLLEERRVIGRGEGAKPREVLGLRESDSAAASQNNNENSANE